MSIFRSAEPNDVYIRPRISEVIARCHQCDELPGAYGCFVQDARRSICNSVLNRRDVPAHGKGRSTNKGS